MDNDKIKLLDFIKANPKCSDDIDKLLELGYFVCAISKEGVSLKKSNSFAWIGNISSKKNPEVKILSRKSTEFRHLDSTFDFIFRRFYNRSHDSFYLPDWTHKNLPAWTRNYNSPISFVLIFLRFFRRIPLKNFAREFKRQASRQYVFNALASEERWRNDSHSNGFISYPTVANKILKTYG